MTGREQAEPGRAGKAKKPEGYANGKIWHILFRYNSITIRAERLQYSPVSGKIGLSNDWAFCWRDQHTLERTVDMMRKLLALALAGLLCLGLTPPAHGAVEELVGLRIDDVVAYSGEECVYTVQEDGLYGFYRVDGSVLLEPIYAAVGPYSDGMAAVSLAGEWVEGKLGGAARFRGGRFGYVDGNGALLIAMQYRQAFPFSEDRAFAVNTDGELVLLDKTGEVLASFPEAELRSGESVQFSDGLAVIPVGGEEEAAETAYLVVDYSGREVCTLTDAYVDFMGGYHDGRIAVAESGEWTLDESGVRRFTASPGAWGYRDEQGGMAIGFQFEEAAPFSDGLAAVLSRSGSGKAAYGFVSAGGEMVVPAEYDGALSYEDGVGALLSEGKWAYVDTEGRLITGFSYDEVGRFREGIALVRSGGWLRAVNQEGVILFTIEAGGGLAFSAGTAVVRQEDGSCGVCDTEGNLLVSFEYEDAYHWDGYLWLKRGEMWRVYRTEDVIDASLSTPEGAPAGVGTFLDVPAGSWYAAAVTWATDHDVITGTGGGLFSPDRSCTRGEILSFLWRAMGRPEPAVENPFPDVSANHYYYQAALWAYENGLVSGELFSAAELCSRSMAVTYLWRLEGCPSGSASAFADVSEDAAYAQAVAWAVEAGITDGSGDGTFSPDEICSRGQIVTFLYRYLVEN